MLGKHITRGLFMCLLLSVGSAYADDDAYNFDDNSFQLANQQYWQQRKVDYGFQRDGKSFYVYGGAVLSYHFNDKTITQYETTGSQQATISAKHTLPDMFNGFAFGFGKEWGLHLDVQLAYVQQLEKTRSGSITTIAPSGTLLGVGTKSMKGMTLDFLYIFNPTGQVQAGASLGAMLLAVKDTFKTDNALVYNLPDDNTTEVDPLAGLSFIFQITPKIALRCDSQYVWHTQNQVASGQVNVIVGMSYKF